MTRRRCCCGECATIGFENLSSGYLLPCCLKGSGYVAHTSFTSLGPTAPEVVPGNLEPLDLLYMRPMFVTEQDRNGDGFVNELDWADDGFAKYTSGAMRPEGIEKLGHIGDWLFDGGRIFACCDPNLGTLEKDEWGIDRFNDNIAALGSSMVVSYDKCKPGLGLISTTNYNTSTGFDLASPTLHYVTANEITGGTWMFKSNTYGSANCGTAIPVMSYERIGDGLLVVCSDRDVTEKFYSSPSRDTSLNCPVFNAIVNTPIDDIA